VGVDAEPFTRGLSGRPARRRLGGQPLRIDLGQLLLQSRAGVPELVDGMVDVIALALESDNTFAELGQSQGVLRRPAVMLVVEFVNVADLGKG
jgi:hypothetical protein